MTARTDHDAGAMGMISRQGGGGIAVERDAVPEAREVRAAHPETVPRASRSGRPQRVDDHAPARQWAAIDSTAEPLDIWERPEASVAVDVRVSIRSLDPTDIEPDDATPSDDVEAPEPAEPQPDHVVEEKREEG